MRLLYEAMWGSVGEPLILPDMGKGREDFRAVVAQFVEILAGDYAICCY